jgi:hypothetical protein
MLKGITIGNRGRLIRGFKFIGISNYIHQFVLVTDEPIRGPG